MKSSLPRQKGKYLLILVCSAFVILVVGFVLRPESRPPSPASEADLTQLQLMSHRREMQRSMEISYTRSRYLMPQLPEARRTTRSPVGWPPHTGEPLLVVASDPNGEPVFLDTKYVGPTVTRCGSQQLRALATANALPLALADGAAFDLNNAPVAIAIPCGDRSILLSPPDFVASLARRAQNDLQSRAGLRARRETDGMRVIELRQDSDLMRSGLRAGDVILEANGNPAQSLDALSVLLGGAPVAMRVKRGDRVLALTLGTEDSGSGIRWRPGARRAEVSSVVPGSIAGKWGLAGGDTVVRAGAKPFPSPKAVDDVLLRNTAPNLVVTRGTSELWLEAPK